jgi:hypothetical protein
MCNLDGYDNSPLHRGSSSANRVLIVNLIAIFKPWKHNGGTYIVKLKAVSSLLVFPSLLQMTFLKLQVLIGPLPSLGRHRRLPVLGKYQRI